MQKNKITLKFNDTNNFLRCLAFLSLHILSRSLCIYILYISEEYGVYGDRQELCGCTSTLGIGAEAAARGARELIALQCIRGHRDYQGAAIQRFHLVQLLGKGLLQALQDTHTHRKD